MSADERARERLSQPKATVKRPAARDGSRPPQRKPSSKRRRQGRSTSATAGIFGGAFVVMAVAVIILVSTLGSTAAFGAVIPFKSAPTSVLQAVTHVPVSELNAAGLGGANVQVTGVFEPTAKQTPITDNGKPVLVYEGAEYCPFCAASRWPLIIALSRFGTFTGLGILGSSPYDVYASTHTFSFSKAQYTSQYLVFDSSEGQSNQCAKGKLTSAGCSAYVTLQATSSRDAKLIQIYDEPPYVPQRSALGIPFLDWGGLRISSGSAYSPVLINPGTSTNGHGWHPLTWSQIINTFKYPTSGPGQAILGTANVYTAAICDMTHNQPSSVCSLPVIQLAEKALPS